MPLNFDVVTTIPHPAARADDRSQLECERPNGRRGELERELTVLELSAVERLGEHERSIGLGSRGGLVGVGERGGRGGRLAGVTVSRG